MKNNESKMVRDDFNRQVLGNDWAIHGGQMGIISPGCLGVLSKTMRSPGILTWSSMDFGENQFSELTLSNHIPAGLILQVFVRRSNLDKSRYGFHYHPDGYWELKLEGINPGRSLANTPGASPKAGDRLRIEIIKNHNRCFHNETEVISVNDSEFQASGEPGVAMSFGGVSENNFPARAISGWTGGSLTLPRSNHPAGGHP